MPHCAGPTPQAGPPPAGSEALPEDPLPQDAPGRSGAAWRATSPVSFPSPVPRLAGARLPLTKDSLAARVNLEIPAAIHVSGVMHRLSGAALMSFGKAESCSAT